MWKKDRQYFVLRCPVYFGFEEYLTDRASLSKSHENIKEKSRPDKSIHLPGIQLIDLNEISFHFEPCRKYMGLIKSDPVSADNGITVYFTKKEIADRTLILKGQVLGCTLVKCHVLV